VRSDSEEGKLGMGEGLAYRPEFCMEICHESKRPSSGCIEANTLGKTEQTRSKEGSEETLSAGEMEIEKDFEWDPSWETYSSTNDQEESSLLFCPLKDRGPDIKIANTQEHFSNVRSEDESRKRRKDLEGGESGLSTTLYLAQGEHNDGDDADVDPTNNPGNHSNYEFKTVNPAQREGWGLEQHHILETFPAERTARLPRIAPPDNRAVRDADAGRGVRNSIVRQPPLQNKITESDGDMFRDRKHDDTRSSTGTNGRMAEHLWNDSPSQEIAAELENNNRRLTGIGMQPILLGASTTEFGNASAVLNLRQRGNKGRVRLLDPDRAVIERCMQDIKSQAVQTGEGKEIRGTLSHPKEGKNWGKPAGQICFDEEKDGSFHLANEREVETPRG
jgi:hypothetical protein